MKVQSIRLCGVLLVALCTGCAVVDNAKPVVYTLPALAYAYDALEPYIDAATLHFHHDDHHRIAVELLNKALAEYPQIAAVPLVQLLKNPHQIPEAIRQTVIDQGGSHYNHSFFWTVMAPDVGGKPDGHLLDALEKTFGTFEKFQELFAAAAKARFGSGYAWLCCDADKKLVILSLANQDSPLTRGLLPLLCLDVWEHAYYLKYQYKRGDFIAAWWHIVNWPQVSRNYAAALRNEIVDSTQGV